MADIKQIAIGEQVYDVADATARATAASKSTVSVAATGTSKDEVKYITIDGVEKKLAGGSGTVQSVGANTGLAISGDSTVNPVVGIDVGYTLPTNAEWNGLKTVDVVNGTTPAAKARIWIDTSEQYGELDPTQVVQSTGQSTTNVMSQKAVTDELANKSSVSVSASGTATDTVQYITVNGVEKKLAGGSGEPDAYLKNAATSGNTLTLTKKDNSTVVYTPTEQYQGTVKSVSAGTGLSISGTATTTPTVNVASTHKLPTTSEWSSKADASALTAKVNEPASEGTNGQVLTTDGSGGRTWTTIQGGGSYTAGNNINIANNTISALKYYKQSDVTGVAGTSTTKVSSTYDVTDASITAYYDGMMVTFVLPVEGISTYGSVFQFNSLGYHPIVYGASSIVGTRYPTGGQITMVYNSVQTATAYFESDTKTTVTGCWQVMDYDANTNTTDAYALIDYYFRPYAGSNIYQYKLCMQDKDNRLQPIVTTNQTSATQVVKTVNTTPLRPEQIWFYNSTDTINAGAAAPKYKLMASDYGTFCAYNFNAAIASYQMIYLAGNYDSTTGLFTLDNSTTTSYYTSVPNKTANITLSNYFTAGKYYILVGSTYGSTDQLQLFVNNPMYYFDGTNLIPYQEHLAKSRSTYQTTAPTAAISDGGVHIVYLTSEPATKYDGYIYMIAES